MSEWKEHKIADLIDERKLLIGDGYRAKNSELFANTSTGIPFARVRNINKGFDFTEVDFYPLEHLDKLGTKISRVGDIVFTSKGTVGRFAFVRETTQQFVYSPQLCFWRTLDNDFIVPRFLFYWMQGGEFLSQVEAVKSQTDMADYVNLADQRQMQLSLPPLPEQRAIADVLSSLDDKIDLLHRQNKTLEAMAETLFRQWFVEEAGADWEEWVLGDVVSVKGGTTPSTKEPEYWDGDIHWSTPRDLSNHQSIYLFDTERKITEKGLAKVGSGLLPVGTLLLSSRAPIGYLAITQVPLAINQGYIAILCDKLVSNVFMYLWCKVNMEEIKSAGNGSTFEEISKSNFKSLPFVLPPSDKLQDFDTTVAPTFEKVCLNQQQIRTLEALRDTLLPKLMSGEVRVSAP